MKPFYLSILIFFSLSSCIKEVQKTTIYLAGDSTVQEYKVDQYVAGWGQYLSAFISNDVQIINKAIGGRSSRSFINEGRLKEILSQIKKGDYLFIQFGHNDDNSAINVNTIVDRQVPLGDPKDGIFPIIAGEKSPTTHLPDEYIKASTATQQQEVLKTISKYGDSYYAYDSKGTYKWFLKQYIVSAREKGAIPVLVTPVSRIKFKDGKIVSGPGHFGDGFGYIKAVIQLAEEEKCLLLNLHEKTKDLFESMGADFASYLMALKPGSLTGSWPNGYDSAYGDQNQGCTGIEGTHYNKFGAYLIAGFIADILIKMKDTVLENGERYTFVDSVLNRPRFNVQPSKKIKENVLEIIYKKFKNVDLKG